ncbi:lysozyme [Drosophila grimshawi]|uniref:lysozyme n=1 Tax=Drosophila grimshawi TaxID=7222 RepID=B4J960_DROGR|nr:lysozyme [Drosophila grimshawi]EDW02435.1 GH19893 [Drosophila grimshawi]
MSPELKTPNVRILALLMPLFLLMSGELVESKQYMRCELTRVLVENYRFQKTLMSNWICLVEHESSLDTNKVTRNENNSKNYGLFQINSKDYCAEGRRGGLCNIKCEDLSNDDISDDIACAKTIQQRDGFKYWKGWNRFCRNTQNLPNLDVSCKLSKLSPLRSPSPNSFY